MRAGRVPRPLPGQLTANMSCIRARRVPRPLPGRLTASMVCLRARRVPRPLAGRLTANVSCMRARRVPRPLAGRLNMSCMAARRVPRPLPGHLQGLLYCKSPQDCTAGQRIYASSQGVRTTAKAARGDRGGLKQGHSQLNLEGVPARAPGISGLPAAMSGQTCRACCNSGVNCLALTRGSEQHLALLSLTTAVSGVRRTRMVSQFTCSQRQGLASTRGSHATMRRSARAAQQPPSAHASDVKARADAPSRAPPLYSS